MAAEPPVDVTKSEGSTRLGVEAVEGLPNNGRNIFNYTTLTPNVAIVQGPDGDEISIGGQKGIHNNVSVDGADFNNPFFGEQRGGQRPAFTFNLDAVQDFVVVADGANAEFGRSSGGFINVITKSGTNEFHGSAHYFGKYDALSRRLQPHLPERRHDRLRPDFTQHQFGATFGGPIVRDKAFFFLAYDQQEYNDIKQTDRLGAIDPALLAFDGHRVRRSRCSGRFRLDLAGPTTPTPSWPSSTSGSSQKHNATLKYNYTHSSQQNGTFDVDSWGRSANALEQDHSHAVNGSLTSLFSSALSNEFRFQWAREDRPRPYDGADQSGDRPPVPRHRHRLRRPRRLPGLPDRHAVLHSAADRVRLPVPGAGQHLAAPRQPSVQVRRRVEPDRGESDVPRVRQRSDGLHLGERIPQLRGQRPGYVECSDGTNSPRQPATGACPAGERHHRTRGALPPAGRRRRRSRSRRRAPRPSSSTSWRCSSRTAGSRSRT